MESKKREMAESHNGSYVEWGIRRSLLVHIQLAKASLMQPVVHGGRKFTPLQGVSRNHLVMGSAVYFSYWKGEWPIEDNNIIYHTILSLQDIEMNCFSIQFVLLCDT